MLHAFFPLLGTMALVFVGYNSLAPWPAPPVAYAPWIVGVWLGMGVLILISMKFTGREEWMVKAGRVLREPSDKPTVKP